MMSRKELAEYAKLTGLNLGQAEKDYFQNMLLFIIYQIYGTEMVFKGGTALKKCYGLGRFSEDLDFTCNGEFDTDQFENGLKRFRLEYTLDTKKYENGLKIMLKIKGPLYTGVPHSLCSFILDISFRENVVLPPVTKTIGRFLEEIPAFDVFVMQEKEIFAEKIRAILSRNKARDVYDLWFLLGNGVEADETLILEKFKYYKQFWNYAEFEESVERKRSIWGELKPLIKTVPDFDNVKTLILKEAKKWNSRKKRQ